MRGDGASRRDAATRPPPRVVVSSRNNHAITALRITENTEWVTLHYTTLHYTQLMASGWRERAARGGRSQRDAIIARADRVIIAAPS